MNALDELSAIAFQSAAVCWSACEQLESAMEKMPNNKTDNFFMNY